MAQAIIPLPAGVTMAKALAISAEFYKIGQPDTARPADYGTLYAFNVLTHPVSGLLALVIDLSDFQPCNSKVDLAALGAVVAPFTTPAERGKIAGDIQAAVTAKQPVTLATAVPPQLKALAIDPTQAKALGWFDQPVAPKQAADAAPADTKP